MDLYELDTERARMRLRAHARACRCSVLVQDRHDRALFRELGGDEEYRLPGEIPAGPVTLATWDEGLVSPRRYFDEEPQPDLVPVAATADDGDELLESWQRGRRDLW